MTPGLAAPVRDRRDVALELAVKELGNAARHFDAMAAKALHWMRVVAANEIAEARWSGIKTHALYRAAECRRVLADIETLREGER